MSFKHLALFRFHRESDDRRNTYEREVLYVHFRVCAQQAKARQHDHRNRIGAKIPEAWVLETSDEFLGTEELIESAVESAGFGELVLDGAGRGAGRITACNRAGGAQSRVDA